MTAAYLHPTVETLKNRLIEPKWLLCPNLRIGNQWKEQVNLSGVDSINLHSRTIKSIAIELAANSTANPSSRIATAFQFKQIVALATAACLQQQKLQYFSEVQSIEQLVELLANSIKDLRLTGVEPNDIDCDSFEISAKADDLKLILGSYKRMLAEHCLLDYADCLSLAIECVGGSDVRLPKDLVVICPLRLKCSHRENELLNALREHSTFVEPSTEEFETASFQSFFRSSVGEVNEVQVILDLAFQQAPKVSLDSIEILHTDYATYVPMIHERLSEHLQLTQSDIESLPVTFAEGIACIYSRPGRGLRSWLRWIRSDYLQTSMTNLIREGLIQFEDDKSEVAIGYASLANRFRKLPVGFGKHRYESILQDAVATAKHSIELRQIKADAEGLEDQSKEYDFGLSAFEKLHSTISSLIQTSPGTDQSAVELLDAATQFLTRFARSSNQFDNYAKAKLLDDISAMRVAIEEFPEAVSGVWEWLENMPVDSRILASGPRPGRIHVDHLISGGHSGRTNTFILGLDDSRFPFRGGQDPLVLDFERKIISSDLETSVENNARSRAEFRNLLARLKGTVTFTFARYSLAADRSLYPSSALLEAFRSITEKPTASVEEFLASIGPPDSFCPGNGSFSHENQWWQTKLASQYDVDSKQESLESSFAHIKSGRIANDCRESEQFTQHDGLVPAAGIELDPSKPDAPRTSPSRLETFGTCPRKFFFRYGLGIYPPVEHVVDHDQWLDALQLGSLLHEVFEDFLRELTPEERAPDLVRDKDNLLKLLHAKIEVCRQTIPVPNQDAYERQLQRLEKTCEIFLRNEEEHCKSTGSVPWILEASIGLGDDPASVVDSAEPVSLTLSDGRTIKVGGRIDRIDRLGGDGVVDFSIWDYKSGSAWGFNAADPFRQGRKLQPYLYARMLRHRLVAAVAPEAKVNYFGYFFPGPKTDGLRLQWTSGELSSGDQIVGYMCDAISAGAFIATNDKSDCKFCDYLPICGCAETTAGSSLVKLEGCDEAALNPVRALRDVMLEEAPPF